MNKAVTIKCDEQGQYSVGTEPAGVPVSPDASGNGNDLMQPNPAQQPVASGGMKPASDLEDALQQARTILEGGDTEGESAEGLFEKGFSGERSGTTTMDPTGKGGGY